MDCNITFGGRKLRRRTKSTASTVALILIVVCLIPLTWAFSAWIVMLVMGGLHAAVASQIPALGFWPCVLVVLALGILKSLLFGDRK